MASKKFSCASRAARRNDLNLLPVITRELRAQARQPFTFWVRVLGAAALLSMSLVFGVNRGFGINHGSELFGLLHLTLLFSIWILVPMMTADCISRERREGTLPLLFLTPLKATDIVIAKGFAHGLRALTLCLAVIPVLTVSFLMGGVAWETVVFSLLINLPSICWALAAGLLASSLNKTWLRSLLSAVIWSVVFLFVFAVLLGEWGGRPPYYTSVLESFFYCLQTGFRTMTAELDFVIPRSLLYSSRPVAFRLTTAHYLVGVSATTLYSITGLCVIVLLAARNVRRNWQEKPPSAFQLWWEKKFCQPVVMLSIFHRWMKFKLERNPIGWLEVRTWSGRLVIWGWFAVMVSIMTIAFWDGNLYQTKFHGIQSFMAWLLVLSVASSAAGSFQRERETGVLELLLVSPLRVQEIINGRLRGLWGQFLPAILLLLGVWIYWTNSFEMTGEVQHILFFVATFATLPVIGLYCSLSSRNFIAALLRTFLWTIVVPVLVVTVSFRLLTPVWFGGAYYLDTLVAVPGVQLMLAPLFWLRLFRNLNERKFSFERAIN